jgi:putative ABC transport system ATP-binding protein
VISSPFINLSLAPGEFVTIIGGNGAGKSTLLNSVAGTLPIEEGQMFLNGEDITN